MSSYPLPPGFTPSGNQLGAASGTLSSVAQSASSVRVLGSSAGRNGAVFYNQSNANCYLAYALVSSLSAFTLVIAASGSMTMGSIPYCGPISAIWDAAGAGNLRVTETT
jgi:hypothetical protein